MKIIIKDRDEKTIITHFSDPEDEVSYYCGYNVLFVKHTSPKYGPLYMYHINDVKSVAVIP